MLSLGAVSPYGETFYREIKPISDLWVPHQKEFCEKHGLERDRLLVEGREAHEVIEEFDTWSRDTATAHNKTGLVFTAFNASFDYPFVDLYYQLAGRQNPYGEAGYCIKSLANFFSKANDWRNTHKKKLPSDIVPEGEFTHNALEDAIWQQKLHFALLGKIALTKHQAFQHRKQKHNSVK
jgi:DNA polymerase III epsilon subunit-like protein